MMATWLLMTPLAVPPVDGGIAAVNMHGSGATIAMRLFLQAMDIIAERSKIPLHMTYRAIGSSNGQREDDGHLGL